MRYFAELAYDGTSFHGWQIQPNAYTVQEALDKALSTILRQKIETLGCGRTDTGVHANEFFAHFNAVSEPHHHDLLSRKFLNSLNSLLPYQVAVKRIIETGPQAHARFDATLRSYEYHIHRHKDPFKYNRSWLLQDKLDIEKMNQAAQYMMSYTDFSAFSKSNTQVFTNNCKITRALWIERDDHLVFHISADRFLRNMVRAIVGTLVLIGKGITPPESIHDIIKSKNRSNAGSSVPACGLYLTEVKYPYIT
ncbi:tRNA pseudouridine(38-40) synthase TruA [Arcticibacter sp.]|jgi:tRNA pseudouridine38-40 synthase|uniref:tRNA pseudouridine(38-40) synthase TruA n=1 Tax=Arcticibacter sp. TaxID=1872630 RepID=UPI0038909C2D